MDCSIGRGAGQFVGGGFADIGPKTVQQFRRFIADTPFQSGQFALKLWGIPRLIKIVHLWWTLVLWAFGLFVRVLVGVGITSLTHLSFPCPLPFKA